MMLNDLEELIITLHNCLIYSQNDESARSTASDIVHICGENINTQAVCKDRKIADRIPF